MVKVENDKIIFYFFYPNYCLLKNISYICKSKTRQYMKILFNNFEGNSNIIAGVSRVSCPQSLFFKTRYNERKKKG